MLFSSKSRSTRPRSPFKRGTLLLIFVLIVTVYVIIGYEQSTDKIRLRGPQREFPVFDTPATAKKYNHAVIVAGHAVMKPNEMATSAVNEDAWNLLDYQRGQGFPQIISSHIEAGVRVARADSKAVLIFSGGQTRRDAGPTSEAASYFYLAQQLGMLSSEHSIEVALEEFARDSFENVLFSICRFHEVTGEYPDKITVVGFDFKRRRFVDIIRSAIEFPLESFEYVGVRPEGVGFNYDRAVKGEADVYEELENDMYGCNNPALRDKRHKRDPFKRTIPYELSCTELVGILRWCGPTAYTGNLPWK